ncbi:MAG: CRISPR-associated endonuclease Cas2 [Pseudomonadales bacterium]|nr:CRISPR-associated endonuclease Cas2 [Pseudomonadales bacterium]
MIAKEQSGWPRRLCLVAYDVRSPKRLHKILHIVNDYASGGQKSVKECYLSRPEVKSLIMRATAILDLDQDSFMIIPLVSNKSVYLLGKARMPLSSEYVYLG